MVISGLELEIVLTSRYGVDVARQVLTFLSKILVFDSIEQAKDAMDGTRVLHIMQKHLRSQPVQEQGLRALSAMLAVGTEPFGAANHVVIARVKDQLSSNREFCYYILEILLLHQDNILIQTHGLAVLESYPCHLEDVGDGHILTAVHLPTALILLTAFAQRIVLQAIWISTSQLGLDSFIERYEAWNNVCSRFRVVVMPEVAAGPNEELDTSRDDEDDEPSSEDEDDTIILIDPQGMEEDSLVG